MNMLQLRKYLKSKRPSFFRQKSRNNKKVRPNWRRPKGIQSKQRLKKGGHPQPIEIGYRSPQEVRGAHKSGLFPVRIKTLSDIDSVNAKTQGIIIGRTVGLRKKILLIDAATKKGIRVLNLKTEKLQKKQQEVTARHAKKKQEEKAVAKPVKKTAKAEPELNEEEKKQAEKEEKDRVLIKREI